MNDSVIADLHEQVHSRIEPENEIRAFANHLIELIHKLKLLGYDVSELEKTQKLLRYDILQDNEIIKICNSSISSEVVKKIHIYNDVLTDLEEQLDTYYKLKRTSEEDINNAKKERPRVQLVGLDLSNFGTRLCSFVLTVCTVTGVGVFAYLPKEQYDEHKNSPPVEGHRFYSTLDDTVVVENEVPLSWDTVSTETIIKDYSEIDSTGNRLVKTYKINDANIKSLASLKEFDLSKYTPIDTELLLSADMTTYNAYRTCDVTSLSIYTNAALVEDIVSSVIMIAIVTVLSTIIHYLMLDEEDEDVFGLTVLANLAALFYDILLALPIYLCKIRHYAKHVNALNNDKSKIEALTNTVCQRIEKAIVSFTGELSQLEALKNAKIVAEAQEKDAELASKKTKLNANREKNIQGIKEILATLSTALSKVDLDNDKELESEVFHSIAITEDTLFETVDDHKKIKDIFLPILKFFDLTLISFDNVDIRGVDFRESNARIFPRMIYRMDATGAKFDNENVPDWANYQGVNLTGAILNEDPGTMVGLDGALMDENTVIGNGLGNSNGAGINLS